MHIQTKSVELSKKRWIAPAGPKCLFLRENVALGGSGPLDCHDFRLMHFWKSSGILCLVQLRKGRFFSSVPGWQMSDEKSFIYKKTP